MYNVRNLKAVILIGSAIALDLCLGVSLHAAPNLKVDRTKSQSMPPLTALTYKLEMSNDNEVCDRVTSMYNGMLKSAISELNADRMNSNRDNDALSTRFLLATPDELEVYGLEPLPPARGNGQLFYADVYDNGRPRVIVPGGIKDEHPQDDYPTVVLKYGDQLKMLVRQSPHDSFTKISEIDPSTIDEKANLPYSKIVVTKNGESKNIFVYLLREWPGYIGIVSKYKHNNIYPQDGIPYVEKGADDEIFLYNKIVYFVRNRGTTLSGGKFGSSMILIYRFTGRGPEDVCYINLFPTSIKW